MKQGWIKLHRQLQDHWLWGSSGELSKLEAWLDICLSCNHSEQKVNIKNQLITVKCGESVQSLTTWSKRWNWNKSKVVRFLGLLEKDGMIESIPCSKTKHIRVCNYATYQHEQNADETQTKRKRNASETKTKTNKNEENEENVENGKNTPLVEEVWSITPRMGKSRSSKAKLKTALSKTKATKEEIIEGLRAWVDSADWKKDGGQFVQGIHIWAKDCKWENPPPKLTTEQPII